MPTLLLNKPYGVLSQFTDDRGRSTLADYIDVPGVYAAGRLDADSEGLLVLTDDGALKQRLIDPEQAAGKVYIAQVEGLVTEPALDRLRRGVVLNDGKTHPAQARVLARKPGWLWRREPPVKPRPGKPVSWLELTLHEGRNRQVRRMGAAVGLPVLRLVRVQVGPYTLRNLKPGAWFRVEE